MKYLQQEGLEIKKDGDWYYNLSIYNFDVIFFKLQDPRKIDVIAIDYLSENTIEDFIKNNKVNVKKINEFYDNVEDYHFTTLDENNEWFTVDVNLFKSLLKELVEIAIHQPGEFFDIIEKRFVEINNENVSNFKIFESIRRINFVDKNNVLVGYEYERDCCEMFGYYISDVYENEVFDIKNTSNVITDEKIIEEIKQDFNTRNGIFVRKDSCSEEFRYKVFNLTNKKQLVIYNAHNGFYHHGFDISKDDVIYEKGEL